MVLDNPLLLMAVGVAEAMAFIALVFYAHKKVKKAALLLADSQEQLKNTKRSIETEKKEALLKVKDEMYRRKTDFEAEMKREKLELDTLQRKLNMKYENLEKKEQGIDELRRELQQKERNISYTEDKIRAQEVHVKNMYDDLIKQLERVSSISHEEAKQMLFDTLRAEVMLESQKWVQKVEEESKQKAKEKSNSIIVTAMQRYASETVIPHASSVVHLPNDDMKGRIIGKEGRNIKSLEMATGMEFVIGDTPEVITISGFNPVRREVAKRALDRLIADGRINPTRIEEVVEQCEKEIEENIQEYGNDAVLQFNLQGVHPEIVTLLGKLHFRTSFSQNVLEHSKEVGIFARMIAQELGLDGTIALRAGLLHDIGKAVTAEVEGPHATIGGDIARRCGEDPLIVNAIAAHHEEVVFDSIYAPIVVVADIISAARPGARRETLATYVKRLEKLEEIGNSFVGVKKAYALQAGREVRIIVEEDQLNDERSVLLAQEIARRIEKEMNFPGQIKVNVIREKRAIDYAR